MSAAVACSHRDELSSLRPPRAGQSIHKEQCTQCFDSQDDPEGIDVCLSCFNGGCHDGARHHARTHYLRSGHPFTLNVKRIPKKKPSGRVEDEEPPAKMKKLSIVEENEEEKWDHVLSFKCWRCDPDHGAGVVVDSSHARTIADGVMRSLSSLRQSEIKAWEEEFVPCEHTLTLEQSHKGAIPEAGLAHCSSCLLTSNLWLCLTCGVLGCGRSQLGGESGNGHALAHYENTSHSVCVKLGTITPEGADIYCYACKDGRTDPDLATHLRTFGINIAIQVKTEKSLTELQIEQNFTFDFSLTAEDGTALQPVFGPGKTGLSNLGNSCYMASVLQTLFSLSTFQERYFHRPAIDATSLLDKMELAVSPKAIAHWSTCAHVLPAECLECQMLKIADGLLSGRYSKSHTGKDASPADSSVSSHSSLSPVRWQAGLKPSTFKALIGKGHAEFATMRQQDAEEFFGYLITVLRRYIHIQASHTSDPDGHQDPTKCFTFGLEQRLQCQSCNRVRYRTDNLDVLSIGVPVRPRLSEDTGSMTDNAMAQKKYNPVAIEECFDTLLGGSGQEPLEYQCEGGCGKVSAIRLTHLASFPDVLVVHAKKFQLVNWVPTKLDIPIVLPLNDIITLDSYLGHGLQPDEIELPEPSSAVSASLPQFDTEAMSQLEGMGFPTVRCQKALLATGNNGTEAAMEWLFAHMEDPDIDDPIQVQSSNRAQGIVEPSADQIAMLVDMGFTNAQAKKALQETDGNAERAVEWLFNHPDDTGEDVRDSTNGSGNTKSSLPGSTRLPAHYRLKAFVSHKGPSVHSGHYVAHIRLPGSSISKESTNGDGDWVLFNDEKVVHADKESVQELKKLAYMYVFERL